MSEKRRMLPARAPTTAGEAPALPGIASTAAASGRARSESDLHNAPFPNKLRNQNTRWLRFIGLAALSMLTAVAAADNQQLELALPTDNDALFHGGGPDFYQYVERDYKRVRTTPWAA